jgi:hypothetical protein
MAVNYSHKKDGMCIYYDGMHYSNEIMLLVIAVKCSKHCSSVSRSEEMADGL